MTTNQNQILFPVLETSKITSTYGIRNAPIPGFSSSNHAGIDIAATRGVNIQSIQSGIVIYSGTSGNVGDGNPGNGTGYGNVLVIKNPDGTSWLYAHLDNNSINFSKGDLVSVGEVIADIGATGSATGYHLHLQKLNVEATALIESNALTNKLGVSSSYLRENSINPTQEILDARNNLSPITSSPSAFETVINFFSSTTTSIYDFFKNFNSEVEEIINTNPYVLAKVGNPNFLIGFNQESSYIVKSGDTLSKIASDNNTSINKILEANPNIENPNLINVGDSIIIPKIVQQHSFNTFNGDKSIQLANSNMIATDAIYVDENGNPTSIYDSLFTTEDSNGNKTTFIRDGIKVKAKDDTFISLTGVINTIESSGDYLIKLILGSFDFSKDLMRSISQKFNNSKKVIISTFTFLFITIYFEARADSVQDYKKFYLRGVYEVERDKIVDLVNLRKRYFVIYDNKIFITMNDVYTNDNKKFPDGKYGLETDKGTILDIEAKNGEIISIKPRNKLMFKNLKNEKKIIESNCLSAEFFYNFYILYTGIKNDIFSKKIWNEEGLRIFEVSYQNNSYNLIIFNNKSSYLLVDDTIGYDDKEIIEQNYKELCYKKIDDNRLIIVKEGDKCFIKQKNCNINFSNNIN